MFGNGKKNTNYFSILADFIENLRNSDLKERNDLYFLLISYATETTRGSRGTVYRFEPKHDLLVDELTVAYKNHHPLTKDNRALESTYNIDLRSDFRAIVKRLQRMHFIPDVGKISNLNTSIDDCYNQKSTSILLFPISYNEELKLVFELAYTDKKTINDEEEQFLSLLLNFSSIMIHNNFLFDWATTDSLTKAYGLHFFNRLLDELIKDMERNKTTTFCLCMLDIDDFKNINDQYGHLAGDEAIRYFADQIRYCSRENDILGRYGGDEFCLILKNTTAELALTMIKRLNERLAKAPLLYEGKTIFLTSSSGIAQFRLHGLDRETLFKNADSALYGSKRLGKNRGEIYNG